MLLLPAMGSVAMGAEEIVLIANPSVTTHDLSLREMRAIFSMRIHNWNDGQSLKVYVLPQQNPIHELFCKELLKIFPHQLQAGWDRLVFSGTGEAPTVVASEDAMIKAVRSTPGAIGYIIKKQETSYENLQVLLLK